MSIPLVDFRRGYHPDRMAYELSRSLTHLAVFIVIVTGVAVYLLAPTFKGKKR